MPQTLQARSLWCRNNEAQCCGAYALMFLIFCTYMYYYFFFRFNICIFSREKEKGKTKKKREKRMSLLLDHKAIPSYAMLPRILAGQDRRWEGYSSVQVVDGY